MKSLLFAAALGMSGVAFAQATEAPADTAQPSGITTTDGTVPGDGITQQGTDPTGAAAAPAGTNEPLVAPPGAVVVPDPGQSAAFAPTAAPAEYPACSRTVTDRCVQTYERGVRVARR